MQRLEFDDCEHFEHKDDVKEIVGICYKKGFQISYEHARKAWQQYSDNLAAGWMRLPEDDEQTFAIVASACYVRDIQ